MAPGWTGLGWLGLCCIAWPDQRGFSFIIICWFNCLLAWLAVLVSVYSHRSTKLAAVFVNPSHNLTTYALYSDYESIHSF